jgi:hypothetical protein
MFIPLASHDYLIFIHYSPTIIPFLPHDSSTNIPMTYQAHAHADGYAAWMGTNGGHTPLMTILIGKICEHIFNRDNPIGIGCIFYFQAIPYNHHWFQEITCHCWLVISHYSAGIKQGLENPPFRSMNFPATKVDFAANHV